MENFLGMHWTLAVSILGVILLLLDLFFFSGDLLTYCADFLYVPVVLYFVPTRNILWLTLMGIFVYAGILSLHFMLWRKLMKIFFNRIVAPDKQLDLEQQLVGKSAVATIINGQLMARIGDEYLLCELDSPQSILSPTSVIVVGHSEDGKLLVKKETTNGEKYV